MGNGPMPMTRPKWDTGEIRTHRPLSEYPEGEWINLKCLKCPRTGRVSRARMIEEHGPDYPMNWLLVNFLTPKYCPLNKVDPMTGCVPCGACFADL